MRNANVAGRVRKFAILKATALKCALSVAGCSLPSLPPFSRAPEGGSFHWVLIGKNRCIEPEALVRPLHHERINIVA